VHAAMQKMRNESSKPCIEREFEELHDAQQTMVFREAKGTSSRPIKLKPALAYFSNSNSFKPSSLFIPPLAYFSACF